jgi:hypothetical protein
MLVPIIGPLRAVNELIGDEVERPALLAALRRAYSLIDFLAAGTLRR